MRSWLSRKYELSTKHIAIGKWDQPLRRKEMLRPESLRWSTGGLCNKRKTPGGSTTGRDSNTSPKNKNPPSRMRKAGFLFLLNTSIYSNEI
jgi:hypothetical protein